MGNDRYNWFYYGASQVVLVIKNLPAEAGDKKDPGSNPELGSSPGEGHDNLLQYSCMENTMDRGTWQTTVHGVSELDIECNTSGFLSFTISQSLLKFMSFKTVMLYNHLILCRPLLLLLSLHQDIFQWIGSLHQVAKVLELQHQSFW